MRVAAVLSDARYIQRRIHLLAAMILLAVFAGWWSSAGSDDASVENLTRAVPSAVAEVRQEATERSFVTIETLRVGDRVPANNPDDGRFAKPEAT